MQKNQIKILVVEDDSSLGPAIETALQRAGYSTQLATNYVSAKSAFGMTEFMGIVCDCMLPQKSGVDLVSELVAASVQPPVVIMTSGIFRDKGFAQDTIHRTKARNFLFKPFDVSELVQELDTAFEDKVEVLKEPIFELLKKRQFSTQDKLRSLRETTTIHGFDLPFVYSLLMDPKISGELEIKYDAQKVSRISFDKARIINVLHHDADSYFGLLLVERGFCSHSEVEAHLKKEPSKKIGQKLVDASILSPHAIQVVHHDQMVIRLSKSIQNCEVHLEFKERRYETDPSAFIDALEFSYLLGDWILSKPTNKWIETFYGQWLENTLVEGPEYSRSSLLQSVPVLAPYSPLFLNDKWPKKIGDIVTAEPEHSAYVLRALHYLLLQRVFVIENKATSELDFNEQINRLKTMRANLAKQNYFEFFNLTAKSKTSDFIRAYHVFAKTLHPDKVDPKAPAELRSLTSDVFALITEAYHVVTNDDKKKEYIKTLALGAAEDVLKAEAAFDDALSNLEKGRFRDARKAFERCLRMKGHRSDTMIFLIWALIREKKSSTHPDELAEKAQQLFNQVAHEDRHSPQYFFVRGLQYELVREPQKAYSHFKHAYQMDPQFLEAKKEMAMIKRVYGKQKTTLADDLSIVVTKMFKKKTG